MHDQPTLPSDTSAPHVGGGAHHAAHHDASHHHVTAFSSLIWTLLALLTLTALTVYTARFVDLGESGNLLVAIGIAVIKSALVVSIFMGLVWDKGLSKVAIFFCLIGLVTFLGFTLIDLSSRGAINAESALPHTPPDIVLQAKLASPEVREGRALFQQTCASCHGDNAQGLPGLGKDMTQSQFIATTPDSELVRFIMMGRLPSDPMNTTGVAMPPKGGDPTLNTEKLEKIVAFIRAIRPYTGDSQGGSGDSH